VCVQFTKYKKTKIEVPVEDIVIRRIAAADGSGAAAAAAFAPTAAAANNAVQMFAATGGLTEDEIKQLIALHSAPEYAVAATVMGGALKRVTEPTAAAAVEPVSEKLVIPEELQPLPTDSEQTKQLKLKKIKRLKNKHRRALLEQAGQQKQNSWQKFTAKAERSVTLKPTAAAAAKPTAAAPAAAAAAAAPPAPEKHVLKHKASLDSLKVLGKKRKSIFSSPGTAHTLCCRSAVWPPSDLQRCG
jgi:hypothetical protein